MRAMICCCKKRSGGKDEDAVCVYRTPRGGKCICRIYDYGKFCFPNHGNLSSFVLTVHTFIYICRLKKTIILMHMHVYTQA